MATGAEIGAGGERERPEVEDGRLEGGLVGWYISFWGG
jgi:hypothetical protein